MLLYWCSEEDEDQRAGKKQEMFQKTEGKVSTRNGSTDGAYRLESGVQSAKNGRNQWRTIALVWREVEQSRGFGWQSSKRLLPTVFPCTLITNNSLSF